MLSACKPMNNERLTSTLSSATHGLGLTPSSRYSNGLAPSEPRPAQYPLDVGIEMTPLRHPEMCDHLPGHRPEPQYADTPVHRDDCPLRPRPEDLGEFPRGMPAEAVHLE